MFDIAAICYHCLPLAAIAIIVCHCYHCQGVHDAGAQRFGGYNKFAKGEVPEPRTHASIVRNGNLAKRMLQRGVAVDASKTHGVMDLSPLARLPYFDLAQDTLLDMMHIAAGVIGRNLMGMLRGDRLNKAIAHEKKAEEKAAAQFQKELKAAEAAAKKKREAIQKQEAIMAKFGVTTAKYREADKKLQALRRPAPVDPNAASVEEEGLIVEDEDPDVRQWQTVADNGRHGKQLHSMSINGSHV